MRNLRIFVAAWVTCVTLAFVAGVWAQPLTSRSLTGLETWQVGIGGPGGTSQFVTTGQMRSSQGVAVTAATSGTLNTLTNVTATLISTAAAGGAMTVNLPTLPWDGEIFEWCNGSASPFTTGNVVASVDGSTIVGSTATGALAASASIEFRYVLSTNSWYKVR